MKYSPYSQGFDDDLYRKKQPRRHTGLWKWLLAVGFGLYFIYRSTLPVVRLQSQPPRQFIDHPARGARGRAQPEARRARAYWHVAVRSIQKRYPPEKTLPAHPPPEFRINSRELSASMEADRDFYWRRLRDLWTEPEIWQVSYGWNTAWFTDFLSNLGQFAGQSLQQFVQSVEFWKDELMRSGIS